MTTQHRICSFPGCGCLGEIHRRRSGGGYYRRRLCTKHKRLSYGMKMVTGWRSSEKRKKIREERGNKCEVCGWVGPCDIHRIIPRTNGGGYTSENMRVICSNCHRLEHYKANGWETFQEEPVSLDTKIIEDDPTDVRDER